VTSYAHVKTLTGQLMVNALALLDAPNAGEVPLAQSHALIRTGNDYADLFTLGAQQSATLASPQALAQPQNQVEATL
jgi:hypothetical protein